MKVKIASLSVDLQRKPIKHLNITVLPPCGQIRVSAPLTMSETAIKMAVAGRLVWIKKQQAKFQNQERQSPREMLAGESHYLWGKRYRLEIMPTTGKHYVECTPKKLKLYVRSTTAYANKIAVLEGFYRKALKREIERLLAIWQPKIGVQITQFGVKKMKTMWGSCNPHSARIWLNLELVKKPVECLEYVLVHELVHLLERQHNTQFLAYMDYFLPNWRQRKQYLNSLNLGV
ncbi:M48 family metallopeptidase [Gallibacterium anatis]|uniref:Metal-dependent hydrolase n=1 Tax=Gallibacterium anatis TaxID=750 RepID=A0A1A7NRX2_9PAST|nr:SprT family zinc-dependent metalloprotease [Gallibacterium anatis]OBW92266.1 metal-dependent hydrolase [Gallibacterium anatis]OBW98898.1 metal-dependent hydrolase [Gallibacterium anatis]